MPPEEGEGETPAQRAAVRRRDMLTNGERDFIESAQAPIPGAAQEQELDLRGVPMPMAYLRIRRALKTLPAGKQLLVAASDAESTRGFPALARLCGRDLAEQHKVDGSWLFVFRHR